MSADWELESIRNNLVRRRDVVIGYRDALAPETMWISQQDVDTLWIAHDTAKTELDLQIAFFDGITGGRFVPEGADA